MRLASWTSASFPYNGTACASMHCSGPRQHVAGHFSVRSERIAPLEVKMSVVYSSIQTLVKQKLPRLSAAVFFLLITSTPHAQIVETGIITGVVKDGTGAVIPNAQVTVLNASTGLRSDSSSDAQGIFVSPPLLSGTWGKTIRQSDLRCGEDGRIFLRCPRPSS